MIFRLPYGNKELSMELPDEYGVNILYPRELPVSKETNPGEKVHKAISHPIGYQNPFNRISSKTSIAISVNDKTRPVPNTLLLTPLLERFAECDVLDDNIKIFIASGTHTPMQPDEYKLILGEEIIQKYAIYPHNCDENTKLHEIGVTNRHTPVYVNSEFYGADVKIVVGDIELHHFAGYSGGVKSAAIGLCGRNTINTNHKLLLDTRSTIGRYEDNPLRQDIEEIGRMIGVDFALNAVLDEDKDIVDVFFGDPLAVMQAGINLVNQFCKVPVDGLYDVVIASAGGYPKDINLYQAQKAMTHASQFCRPGGSIVLYAECREGVGSQGYIDYMQNVTDLNQVIERFTREGFVVGPHKAYQIARILEKCQIYMGSSINTDLVKSLFINPIVQDLQLTDVITGLSHPVKKIAVLPYATACIPQFSGVEHE